MSKRLIIAEKPSVAGDLARALGKFKKSEGFYESGDAIVTHAVGHLVELFMPNDFKPEWRFWKLENLPMIPEEFRLKPIERTKPQFNTVVRLIKRKDVNELVNACDAGREGELIFRYLYALSGTNKPFSRLWLSSMTAESIREGFKALRAASEMQGLADAAVCRSESDWLIGINGTRAFTCRIYGRVGAQMCTVGRVQTPTLAIVVDRENTIREFKKRPFWEVVATFTCAAGSYEGRWFDRAFKKDEKDPERKAERIWEEARAQEIVARVLGKTGEVAEEKKATTQLAPLLYDLTTLQRECNARFGLSASRTLQIAQALYERRKAITYPRTDSRALPENHLGVVRQTLTNLKDGAAEGGANPYAPFAGRILEQGWVRPNKRIFNDAKVSDHFAIIPTHECLRHHLVDLEAKVFDMICRRFLAVFYPAAAFEVTTRITTVEGEPFKTEGKILKEPGWLEVYGRDQQPEGQIPPVKPGEHPLADPVLSKALETKPPARYTEATLLSAMEGAGKLLDDEELGEAMKERGLGTPATRAAIIEQLLAQEYLHRLGRDLVATSKGISLIQMLRSIPVPELTSPQLTGEWESQLREMENGRLPRAKFMEQIREITRRIVEDARKYDDTKFESKVAIEAPCPKCGGKIRETFKWFACAACDFLVWKSIASKSLTVAEVEELLREKKIGPLDGFRSKAGKPFQAMLVIGADFKVSLAWDHAGGGAPGSPLEITSDKVFGQCPVCGASVRETAMAWCCEKRAKEPPECEFRISKKIKGKDIPPEQLEKLLGEGKTDLIEGFISAKHRPFKAHLTMAKGGKLGWEFAPRAGVRRKTAPRAETPAAPVAQGLTEATTVPRRARSKKGGATKKSAKSDGPEEGKAGRKA
ncbi:MAG: DNA topoisomerase III [Verrucomicrobiae bacterium]|nr:DNA topoisomerase III [Verrucomicrobiae bacterium]